MIPYVAPSPEHLQQLKQRLAYTGEQMAELASVAGGQQWRKYTGGAEPRQLNLHQLFFIAARLTLSTKELEQVVQYMNELGAIVKFENFSLSRHPK